MDDTKIKYSLFYYIPWSDSQVWLGLAQQIEDGDVVPSGINVFVSKDLYDYCSEEI